MPTKTINFAWIVFILVWIFTIFSEYLRYDPYYSKAIELFQYSDLLMIILSIGVGFSIFINKRKYKPFNYLNGVNVFLALLLLDVIAVGLFYNKLDNLEITTAGFMSHLAHVIGVSGCLFSIYLVVRLLGLLFTNVFPPKIVVADLPVVQVSIGVMIFTFFLFFLGLFDLLFGFIIIPICILILTIYWRSTVHILRGTLFNRISLSSDLNSIGVFSFLILGVFLIINYVHVLRPFPMGTDSLNLYVNIPSLISQYNGLVDGNQPYNWSVFMSSGLLIFNRMDVVLALSFFGGLLSLFALYRLSRKWLDVNYSALVLLLFYSLPMINFLSYLDMKVDMGLLFISLSILLLYYNWLVNIDVINYVNPLKELGLQRAKSFFSNRLPDFLKHNRNLVYIGLLFGFAFGIKLTILFFLFALLCAIWFVKGGKLTFLASFFLCFSAVFFTSMDTRAGLRQFHGNVDILKYILLLIGLGFLVYSTIYNRGRVISLFKYSFIIGSFFLIPIMPWIGKNYVETGQVNIVSLLNGEKASPIISFEEEEKIKDNIDNQTRKQKRKERLGGRKDRTRGKEKDLGKEKVFDKEESVGKEDSIGKERRLDKDKNLDNDDLIESTSVNEDLHRFMGYELVPIRYLTLPFDVFIKSNVSRYFTDISYLLLLLFPILFLFPSRLSNNWRPVLRNLGFIVLAGFLLVISIPSSFLNKNNLSSPVDGIALLEANEAKGFFTSYSDAVNGLLLKTYTPIFDRLASISEAKDSYTYPILILLFLIILYLFYERIKHHPKATQSFVIFLSMYFFLWWILGSGVAWYGILIFCLSYIFLLYNILPSRITNSDVVHSSNLQQKSKKYLILLSCAVWIFLAFVKRTANYSPNDKEAAKLIFFPSILEYQTSKISEQRIMDLHFPNIKLLADIINKDEVALVYRVGSPINFFIDKNDSRVLNDTFLDTIMRLINKFDTKEEIISYLKKEGYKYIVFDLNMATYDETPEKTLTIKFTQFMNVLYHNDSVELLATDRIIKLNNEAKDSYGVFPEEGSIVSNGGIAIYRIK